MEAINPFSDPEFKRKLLKDVKKGSPVGDPDDYVMLEDDEEKMDMKSIIAGSPKLPKQANNIILDAIFLLKTKEKKTSDRCSYQLIRFFQTIMLSMVLTYNLILVT